MSFAKNFYNKNNCANLHELIELVANWQFVFINPLNEFCSPNRIFNKTIYIDCNSGSIIDLMEFKSTIVNNINIYFGQVLVTNVVFLPRF